MTWLGMVRPAAGEKNRGSKPATAISYYCMECGSSFSAGGYAPYCRTCGNQRPVDLVPIHVEYDAMEAEFYCACDWHGG